MPSWKQLSKHSLSAKWQVDGNLYWHYEYLVQKSPTVTVSSQPLLWFWSFCSGLSFYFEMDWVLRHLTSDLCWNFCRWVIQGQSGCTDVRNPNLVLWTVCEIRTCSGFVNLLDNNKSCWEPLPHWLTSTDESKGSWKYFDSVHVLALQQRGYDVFRHSLAVTAEREGVLNFMRASMSPCPSQNSLFKDPVER